MKNVLISDTQGSSHGTWHQEQSFSERSVYLVAKQAATGLVSVLQECKHTQVVLYKQVTVVFRASGLPAVRAQARARERRSTQHADWLRAPGESVRIGPGFRVEADRDGDSRSASEVAGTRETTRTPCYSQE